MSGGRFLVLGAGGLGCPALLGLVAGGARELALVDCDAVDATNLQRQILYGVGDVGAPKVLAAARNLRARAPALRIEPVALRLDERSLPPLLAAQAAGTVVLECSDQPDLKFMVQDACLDLGLPLVVGGAQRWGGLVMAVARGGACLRCVFEAAPPPELAPSCAAVGVLGGAAGTLGFLMAHLALALHAGDDVAGALISLDVRELRPRQLRPRPRPDCPGCAPAGERRSLAPLRAACSASTPEPCGP